MSAHDDTLRVYQRLFLAHQPERQAWMNQPDQPNKYTTVHHAPSATELARHLAGQLTLAIPTIGRQGLAYHAAGDIDHGGADQVRRFLAVASSRGFTFFGITSTTEAHDGGHVWALFDQLTEPRRLRQLVKDLAKEAGCPTIEAYPARQPLRLPYGRHTWTGRRGQLLLPDGTTIDLDDCSAEQFVNSIAALPRNQVAQLPEPAPAPRPQPRPSQPLQLAPGRARTGLDVIAEANQQLDLVGLLEGAGGRIAEQLPSGEIVMHCPCSGHQHGDSRPSLILKPASAPRYGRLVAHGYSPSCAFFTEPGQVVDAFTVYCWREGLDRKAAIRKLAGGNGPKPSETATKCRIEHENNDKNGPAGSGSPDGAPPAPTPPQAPTGPQEAAQSASADQTGGFCLTPQKGKVENGVLSSAPRTMAANTCADHKALLEQVAHDPQLNTRDRRVLGFLVTYANGRTWCRPAVERIAGELDMCKRTVQRALAQLESAGYITTLPSHGQHTAIRQIHQPDNPRNGDCHPKKSAEQADCHPSRDLSLDLTGDSGLTCERGGDSQPQPQLDALEPIGDPAGAQYCAAWAVEPSGPPTYRRRRDKEDPEAWASVNQTMRVLPVAEVLPAPAQIPLVAGGLESTTSPAPRSRQAAPATPTVQLPRWADEASRRRYYGLLGKAKKSKSTRQRLALERQAAALAAQVLQAGPQPTPVEQLIATSPPAALLPVVPQPALPVVEPEPWADELVPVLLPAGIRRTPSIWRITQAIERARLQAT